MVNNPRPFFVFMQDVILTAWGLGPFFVQMNGRMSALYTKLDHKYAYLEKQPTVARQI